MLPRPWVPFANLDPKAQADTINQLAEAYLDRKQRETGRIIPHDQYATEKQKVKMFIADHNVFGVDLNPVAVLINKAMIEIPPKFAGRPPVNPESRKGQLDIKTWKGAQGLAAAARQDRQRGEDQQGRDGQEERSRSLHVPDSVSRWPPSATTGPPGSGTRARAPSPGRVWTS